MKSQVSSLSSVESSLNKSLGVIQDVPIEDQVTVSLYYPEPLLQVLCWTLTKANMYKFYKIQVSEDEKQTKDIRIEVQATSGDPDLYVSHFTSSLPL